jgi:hypothetical protein
MPEGEADLTVDDSDISEATGKARVRAEQPSESVASPPTPGEPQPWRRRISVVETISGKGASVVKALQ